MPPTAYMPFADVDCTETMFGAVVSIVSDRLPEAL